jgi:hypothetical protein
MPLWWCLPLLGFVTFLLAFPIDRRIPFWSEPRRNFYPVVSFHRAHCDYNCNCDADETQTSRHRSTREIARLDSHSDKPGRECIRPRWHVGVDVLTLRPFPSVPTSLRQV